MCGWPVRRLVMTRLILASASPRRRDILRSLGVCFQVLPIMIDEVPRPHEPVHATVERLAREKTLAAAATLPEAAGTSLLILGADTVVVVDGELLGKPRSAAEASHMLARLAGRTHEVLTGIALLDPNTPHLESAVGRTLVTFSEMAPEQIGHYVATGTPFDKAGAYGIQDPGAWFVRGIEGSFTNVVGLPAELFSEILARFGLSPADLATP